MTANLESVVVKVVVNSSYNQFGNLNKKKKKKRIVLIEVHVTILLPQVCLSK